MSKSLEVQLADLKAMREASRIRPVQLTEKKKEKK